MALTTAVSGAARRVRARRWPAGLAWALWTLAMLCVGLVLWLDQVLRDEGRRDLLVVTPSAISPVLGAIGVATVGAVLAGRRPRHPVGWLMLGMGLSLSAAGLAVAYTNYGVAHGDAAPGANLVGLYPPAGIVTAIVCDGFILLLTPTGSLPSSRWRWWAWLTAATPVALVLVVALGHGPDAPRAQAIHSPLDLHALDAGPRAAYQAAFAVIIGTFLLAGASLVVRFRRAGGIERQQLRWVALSTVLIVPLSLAHLVALAVGAFDLAPVVGGLNPPILAAAVGAAILRYRLYDLDRIISRTLAYGFLTVLLGGGYALVILGLGQLIGHSSSLVVAATTLATAAAFQPLRSRVQRAVDRRFNRRRYDAGRTIEAFGARLRQQLDLDTLTAELLDVIDQTMQPTTVSLALRQTGRPTGAAAPGRRGADAHRMASPPPSPSGSAHPAS